MKRIALAVVLMFGLVTPVWAGLMEGYQALARGDYETFLREFLPLAEQGHDTAQYILGELYENGEGVPQDYAEAAKWYRMAADQGVAAAQLNLGGLYARGEGVPQNYAEAVKWYRKSAAQGYARAQASLGAMYAIGKGVPQDYVQAHMWFNLAAAAGEELNIWLRDRLARKMTPAQLAEAQRLAREWRPKKEGTSVTSELPAAPRADELPQKQRELKKYATGSGFVVSRSGQVLTNNHVVNECREVRIPPEAVAEIAASDPQSDLALLKLPGQRTKTATFRQGRGIRPGDSVVVVGFPLQGVLSSDLNVTTGIVSALAGPGNDRRLMQLTAPVQPGNSGGPLLDLSGNVVGVVVGKLDAIKLAQLTGDIPQNVNFAIAGGIARAFMDANGVHYEMASPGATLSPAEVAERAKEFTLLIECWK
ncbi:MAG: tetratricopeptide repeat-containing serine protease family protein [Alphaproteobacteria bacterium]